MAKTVLIEEDNYWDIKDAQTTLEREGLKMTLPELMSIIIPDTEEIVNKTKDEKTRIYFTNEQGDEVGKPQYISIEETINMFEDKDNSFSDITTIFKRSIIGIRHVSSNNSDVYYEIMMNTSEYNTGGLCYIYIPEKIIDKFKKYITGHKIINGLLMER